ncbi:MAG: hypothetical protein ACE5O2_03515 [Armatimonadota bacterium]
MMVAWRASSPWIVVILAALAACARLAGSAPGAAPVRVRASAQPRRVTVGDIITYTITASFAEGASVQLPGLEADLSPFEVRDYQESEARTRHGRAITGTYKLALFETGPHDIPSIEVRWRLRNGEEGSEKTAPVSITVVSVLGGNTGDIRDIKGPRDAQPGHLTEVIVGVAAVAAVAILVILGVWARRRGPVTRQEPAPPPRPPDAVALEMLQRLADSTLLAEERVKQYYSELSDIVRQYVEGRYDVPALERTTDELLGDLRHRWMPRATMAELAALLRDCDLVKFAKWRPERARAQDAVATAIRIVRATAGGAQRTAQTAVQGPTGARAGDDG